MKPLWDHLFTGAIQEPAYKILKLYLMRVGWRHKIPDSILYILLFGQNNMIFPIGGLEIWPL